MGWLGDGWLEGVDWRPSPNYGDRPIGMPVSLIVIHNISLPPDEFAGDWVEDFFLNRLDPTVNPYFGSISQMQVSAHFYVRRDGRIIQFVGCDRRAWHAGQSSWDDRDNCNDFSVGIELEGSDFLPFAEAQYAALWRVFGVLRDRYPIDAVAGHCHVAPGRKSDPGPYFDWAALRANCAGLTLPIEISA